MFEEIPEEHLGYTPNFDDEEMKEKMWFDALEKILKRSSSFNSKAERLEHQEKFKTKWTKDTYFDYMMEQRINPNQIIPKHRWLKKSFFDKSEVTARLHPHFFAAFYESCNQYTTKNETLVLVSCKEAKPYSQVAAFKTIVNIGKDYGFDVAVLSATVCPLYPFDASTQYPFSIYNWDGSNRVGQYDELVSQWSAQQIGHLILKHGYKNIILISTGGIHYVNQFNEMQKQYGHLVNFYHLGDPQTFSMQVPYKVFGSYGLAGTRFQNIIWSRMLLLALLGCSEEEIFEYMKDCVGFDDTTKKFFGVARELDPNITNWEDIFTKVRGEGFIANKDAVKVPTATVNPKYLNPNLLKPKKSKSSKGSNSSQASPASQASQAAQPLEEW